MADAWFEHMTAILADTPDWDDRRMPTFSGHVCGWSAHIRATRELDYDGPLPTNEKRLYGWVLKLFAHGWEIVQETPASLTIDEAKHEVERMARIVTLGTVALAKEREASP